MSIIGSFDRAKHFSELATPLDTAEGVLSPSTRRARVIAGLGMSQGVGGARMMRGTATPATAADTATLTAAQLATGLILATPTAAASYTLPTITLLLATFTDWAIGDAFEFIIVNLGATGTFDITILAGTGGTLVGNMVIADQTAGATLQTNNTSAKFQVRRSGAATYDVYRVS